MNATPADPFASLRAALVALLDTAAGGDVRNTELEGLVALIPPAPDPEAWERHRRLQVAALRDELSSLCADVKLAGCARLFASTGTSYAEDYTALIADFDTALQRPTPVGLSPDQVAVRALKLVTAGVAAERMSRDDLDGATAALAAANGITPADWHRLQHTMRPNRD